MPDPIGREDDDPEAWLTLYGDALFRFALARVRQREIAEDLVQETFVSAVRSKSQFRGDCARSTWLFAILRRRIADHFRRHERRIDEIEAGDPNIDAVVQTQPDGRRSWSVDPALICEDREFHVTLASCLRKIPEHLAEAFVLRHQNGLSPAEIREWLGISATNLSMRLHRARLAVRDCLAQNWFEDEEGPG